MVVGLCSARSLPVKRGAYGQPRRVLSGLRGGGNGGEGDDLGVYAAVSANAGGGGGGGEGDADASPSGECPMGQYLWSTGDVWPEKSRACLPCPVDTFWDNAAAAALPDVEPAKFGRCTSCPAGKHQPMTGMLGCDPVGKRSAARPAAAPAREGGGEAGGEAAWVAAAGCSDCCAAGLFRMYLNSAFAYCKPCPIDKFWPRPSAATQAVYVCRGCPAGKHQPLPGKSYCLGAGETQAQYERTSKQLVVQATAFLRNVQPAEMTGAWLAELTAAVASVTGGRKADVVATDIKPFGVWSDAHPGATHGMRLEIEQRADSDVVAQNVLAILGMADFTKILKKHMMDDGEWLPDDVSLVIKHPRVADANHRATAAGRPGAAGGGAGRRGGGGSGGQKRGAAAKAVSFLRAASRMVEGRNAADARRDTADDDVSVAVAAVERRKAAAAAGGGGFAAKAVGVSAAALFACVMWFDRNGRRAKVNNPFKPMEIHGKL
jgi:hypothetical protein